MLPLTLALLAAPVTLALRPAPQAPAGAPDLPAGRPSVLVVLLDDVGTDMLGCYGDPAAPCTPNIDALAAAGVRLTRAYANPICSPTRAALLTGRHAFRTGVGFALSGSDPDADDGLALAELALPEHLAAGGYATAAIGKWHLLGPGDPDTHPNDHGFGHYRGSLNRAGGSIGSYFSWPRTVDGVTAPESSYATTRQTLDALEVLGSLPRPWFGFVALSAAHGPFQAPPPAACPSAPGCACPATSVAGRRERYEAIVESADAHLGVLVRALVEATQGELVVMLLGDNGTPNEFAQACPRAGKAYVYEGGIRVPWIVWGPGIAPAVRDDLVQVTDVFATVCELAGLPVPASAEDSLSFLPVLHGAPGARATVYEELFTPTGLPFAPTRHLRAIGDGRWKLLRHTGASLPAEELFDLWADPCETTDLLQAPLSPEAQRAYFRLEDELELLGVG